MNKLDIHCFYVITSFLAPRGVKRLGSASQYVYNNCRQFMTYMYSEYGNNELYHNLASAKWIVHDCNIAILEDCINKKLKIVSILFAKEFNKSIESLGNCGALQQITFSRDSKFNQSIESLQNCKTLQQMKFGFSFNEPIEPLRHCGVLQQIKFGYSFNQSIKPLRNCVNLQQITFSYSFNQSIKPLINCSRLTTLSIHRNYNKPLDVLHNINIIRR
jgi:hypothetical protein